MLLKAPDGKGNDNLRTERIPQCCLWHMHPLVQSPTKLWTTCERKYRIMHNRTLMITYYTCPGAVRLRVDVCTDATVEVHRLNKPKLEMCTFSICFWSGKFSGSPTAWLIPIKLCVSWQPFSLKCKLWKLFGFGQGSLCQAVYSPNADYCGLCVAQVQCKSVLIDDSLWRLPSGTRSRTRK